MLPARNYTQKLEYKVPTSTFSFRICVKTAMGLSGLKMGYFLRAHPTATMIIPSHAVPG